MPTETPHECDNVEDILTLFFNELALKQYKYCVLHSYDTLPRTVGSDLDIAISIDSISDFESLLADICCAGDWAVIQKLWYDIPDCIYYVLKTNNPPFRFIAIDILVDSYGIGRYGFSTDTLLDAPVQHGLFYRSDTSIEFCYKITKRIRKGEFKSEDKRILNDLYARGDHRIIQRLLTRHFGSAGSNEILSIFNSTHGFTGHLDNIFMLSAKQLLRKRYASPSIIAKRFYWQTKRVLYRISHPAGIVVKLPERLFNCNESIFTKVVGPAFRYMTFKKNASTLDMLKALSTSGLLITTTQGKSPNTSILSNYTGSTLLTSSGIDESDEIARIASRIERILRDRIAMRARSCMRKNQP